MQQSYAQLSELRTTQTKQQERQRIAFDLHDDLGAKLLTIAQASMHADDRERISGMARQALDEMRLSVRGLTGEAVRNLGGIHTFSAGALGGTLLSLSVPLEVMAEITTDITTGKTAPPGEGPAGAIR
ncbi:MAG: hypothetical protein H7332_05860 [Bdellovibrionales bacterium]|nr:hypothetical protein [Ramlibacter sp.]